MRCPVWSRALYQTDDRPWVPAWLECDQGDVMTRAGKVGMAGLGVDWLPFGPALTGWAIAAAIAGVVAVAGIILALRGNEPPSTAKPGGATDTPAEPSEGIAKPELKPGNPPGCEEMPSSLTIAPCLPSDIPGGANNATLFAPPSLPGKSSSR